MRPNSTRFRRVKSRLILSSVDKWLTKNCIKKIKSLVFSDLIKNRVPRTGLEPARLSARAPETRASTIPPPGHRVLVVQRYERFSKLQNF